MSAGSYEPVQVELGERSYDVRFFRDDLDGVARAMRPFCPETVFVISNPTVWGLHGEGFAGALGRAGIAFATAMIGDGERFKTLDSAAEMYDALIRSRCSRRTCVAAFGGGVVGDLAGFVAATFLRGVSFVQVPTTVVSMVDSSVGGKTGVDHPLGKNLVGAFHQPRLVAADLGLLATLDRHNLHGGFGEVIKYGVIWDAAFFEFLERNIGRALALDPDALAHVVRRSCQIKAQVVGTDEREAGLRAILNFGHTFAHAIENADQYRETQFHGQAVGIGMAAACRLACRMGLLADADAQRVVRLVEAAGLPARVPAGLAPRDLIARMATDKKVQAGRVRFVLPLAIGSVEIRDDVPADLLEAALGDLAGDASNA